MNLPRQSLGSGSSITGQKEIYIQTEQPTGTIPDQSIWIKTDDSLIPYSVYRYDKESDSWIELNVLEQNIVVSQDEPTNKYDNLVWFVIDGDGNVTGIKVWVNDEWKDVNIGSPSGASVDTYKVKASGTDSIPGYLDEKVDNETIQVTDNKLSVKFQDDQKEDVVWSSQRVTKEAIIKAIIFG